MFSLSAAKVQARLAGIVRPRILVVRNDGLGDFILTMPLVAALKHHLPLAEVYALVNQGVAGLVPLLPDLAGAIVDPGVLLNRHRDAYPESERTRLRQELQGEVRAKQFDMAILPYAERGTAALVHRAGIGVRAGPLRRHLFWRFNVRNPESRKKSLLTEYELNNFYLHLLGFPPDYYPPAVRLPANAEVPQPAGPYVVIHPLKRMGTALNWPPERFVELAQILLAKGWHVVAVGDAVDAPTLRPLLAPVPQVRIECGLSLPGLATLLAGARLFVGNSSGPLHVAALVGTPQVGLYPRARVVSPTRWSTLPPRLGPGNRRDYLLAADVLKDCIVCEGQKCEYFNCVERISPRRVLDAMGAWGVAEAPH